MLHGSSSPTTYLFVKQLARIPPVVAGGVNTVAVSFCPVDVAIISQIGQTPDEIIFRAWASSPIEDRPFFTRRYSYREITPYYCHDAGEQGMRFRLAWRADPCSRPPRASDSWASCKVLLRADHARMASTSPPANDTTERPPPK